MHDQSLRLDPAQIGRTLDHVAEIGNRYAGTPDEAAARDYLLERFNTLGLANVRLEPFRYLAYERGTATCTLNGPERLEFEAHPLQYTALGETSGEAVYLGDAADADFERIDARD